MKYFVSADIHGYYAYFMEALAKAGFSLTNPHHKIIICGDLLDRGREPKELINFVLEHRDKIIFIRGNHEDLMEDMLVRNYPTSADYHNGTYQTLLDLGYIEDSRMKDIALSSNLRQVLDLALNYYETKHYIFVHSWLPALLSDEGELSLDPNWREANYLGWLRAKWINPVMMYQNGLFDTNKTIVSGHWHVNAFHALYDEDKEKGKTNYNPFVTPKFIGLDACTIVSKQVNCIVLEDEET